MATALVIVLIGGALSAIALVVARKFPQLSSMNVKESPKERLRELKRNLVIAKIVRKARALEKRIVSKETLRRAKYIAQEAYKKLKVLEEKYRKHTNEAKVELLLKRGRSNLVDDPELAEQCFLDVITLDAHNLTAYEGLLRIYLARKSFKEAKEVLEFLTKLNPASAGRYLFELAEALLREGDKESAWKYGVEATALEPSNPKYLDFLVELAILKGHRKEGEKYLEKLKKVNPENAKIVEFEERIKNLE